MDKTISRQPIYVPSVNVAPNINGPDEPKYNPRYLRNKLAHQKADVIIDPPLLGIKFPGEEPIIVQRTGPILQIEIEENGVKKTKYTFYLEDELGEFSVDFTVNSVKPSETWSDPTLIINKQRPAREYVIPKSTQSPQPLKNNGYHIFKSRG